ncbi:MAG: hypothetical protein AB1591_09640 [Pseudomonadota bacterium]
MSGDSKRLLHIYRSLSEGRRQALVEYAEYLVGRDEAEGLNVVPQQPLDIPRPAQESVVKAIQRLMSSYPMLDRNKLLHETSAQMTRHLVHGVPAAEVIDELEIIFRRHYESHGTEKASG